MGLKRRIKTYFYWVMNRKTDREIIKVYAENLKVLRKSKKITQEELGIKIDRSEKQVAKYEQGVGMLSLEMAQKVAEVLDISIDEIAGHAVKDKEQVPPNMQVMLKEINQLEAEHLFILEEQMKSFLKIAKKVVNQRRES